MINMLLTGVPANIMALAGLVFAFVMTCLLLARCNDRLPKDREENSLSTAHCPQANQEVPDLYLFLYLLQLLYCFVN